VWHGNYIKFFEDGREAFGEKYDLHYLDIYNHGYFTPIVKTEITHKAPIAYGDTIKMITKFVPQRSAKMVFDYEIINADTQEVCAVGRTMQVFLKAEVRILELNAPEFYDRWRKENNVHI